LSLSFSGAAVHAQNAVVLVGSGSSAAAPLYNLWGQEYAKRNSNVQLRYIPSGTGEGIMQISHGISDFGTGESPLTEQERKEGGILELPAVLICIVPIYNLPAVHQELRLSGEVLAEIFLGEIKNWNASPIAKLNPGVTLPDLPIQVVHRPDGRGSNYVFTDFLSKTSPRFRAEIGVTASPKWPVGTTAARSSDMVDKVKSEVGTIGFVELEYALKSNVTTIAVLNPAGKFVKATEQSISAACEAMEAPLWNSFSASLTNAGGEGSYPITSFTWIYIRSEPSDITRTAALCELLDWIYSDGQQFADPAGYTRLPSPLVVAARKKVQELYKKPRQAKARSARFLPN
jgi:phosphate transport system substrate-binding protein